MGTQPTTTTADTRPGVYRAHTNVITTRSTSTSDDVPSEDERIEAPQTDGEEPIEAPTAVAEVANQPDVYMAVSVGTSRNENVPTWNAEQRTAADALRAASVDGFEEHEEDEVEEQGDDAVDSTVEDAEPLGPGPVEPQASASARVSTQPPSWMQGAKYVALELYRRRLRRNTKPRLKRKAFLDATIARGASGSGIRIS